MLAPLTATRIATFVLQATELNQGMTPDQQFALEAMKRRGSAMNGATDILVPLAFFAMVAVIFWLLLRQKQARMQARADLNKQLLDKFSSGREFAEFLESKGSQRFLEEPLAQNKSSEPQNHILVALRKGIILVTLGLGMLGLTFAKKGFLVPAVLVLALGVGFLISTAIAHRLSMQSGKDQGPKPESASAS